MSFQSKKKIELPSKEQVELRKAEKRWIRPSEVEADLAQTEKETQVSLCWITWLCYYGDLKELFRKFVSILKKLTPQTFEMLANQALQMPINSEDRLKGCIDRIFIKVYIYQRIALFRSAVCPAMCECVLHDIIEMFFCSRHWKSQTLV